MAGLTSRGRGDLNAEEHDLVAAELKLGGFLAEVPFDNPFFDVEDELLHTFVVEQVDVGLVIESDPVFVHRTSPGDELSLCNSVHDRLVGGDASVDDIKHVVVVLDHMRPLVEIEQFNDTYLVS